MDLSEATRVATRCEFRPDPYAEEPGATVDVFFLIAEAPDGSRWAHGKEFAREDEAEAFEARVAAAMAAGRKLDEGCWYGVQASYMSDAYVAEGWEARQAHAERCGDELAR